MTFCKQQKTICAKAAHDNRKEKTVRIVVGRHLGVIQDEYYVYARLFVLSKSEPGARV